MVALRCTSEHESAWSEVYNPFLLWLPSSSANRHSLLALAPFVFHLLALINTIIDPMARHIPAAPRLDIDREVYVFVHHTAPESGINHRYRILGEDMLKMAYTAALFNTRPDLVGTKLQVSQEWAIISPG